MRAVTDYEEERLAVSGDLAPAPDGQELGPSPSRATNSAAPGLAEKAAGAKGGWNYGFRAPINKGVRAGMAGDDVVQHPLDNEPHRESQTPASSTTAGGSGRRRRLPFSIMKKVILLLIIVSSSVLLKKTLKGGLWGKKSSPVSEDQQRQQQQNADAACDIRQQITVARRDLEREWTQASNALRRKFASAYVPALRDPNKCEHCAIEFYKDQLDSASAAIRALTYDQNASAGTPEGAREAARLISNAKQALGVVQAASSRLALLSVYEEFLEKSLVPKELLFGTPTLPSLESMKEQETDLVSASEFLMELIEKGYDVPVTLAVDPEVQQKKVPRVLAQHLADAVAESFMRLKYDRLIHNLIANVLEMDKIPIEEMVPLDAVYPHRLRQLLEDNPQRGSSSNGSGVNAAMFINHVMRALQQTHHGFCPSQYAMKLWADAWEVEPLVEALKTITRNRAYWTKLSIAAKNEAVETWETFILEHPETRITKDEVERVRLFLALL